MALELDPKTTALVIIDLQYGILALPLAPYDQATMVERVEALGQSFASAGAPIFPVRVAFGEGFVEAPPGVVDQSLGGRGPLPENWSTLEPRIAALPAAGVITKHSWGAFAGSELDLLLRRRGITTIALCGIATNFGVESTAREAWALGYSVVVVGDCCTSLGADLHQFSMEKILPRIARVRAAAEVTAALAVA